MKRDILSVSIEQGGLSGLDPLRVATVVMFLGQAGEKCRRQAESYGQMAIDDHRNGYFASFESQARTAWRHAQMTLAYRDAMLWIMAATAKLETAVP